MFFWRPAPSPTERSSDASAHDGPLIRRLRPIAHYARSPAIHAAVVPPGDVLQVLREMRVPHVLPRVLDHHRHWFGTPRIHTGHDETRQREKKKSRHQRTLHGVPARNRTLLPRKQAGRSAVSMPFVCFNRTVTMRVSVPRLTLSGIPRPETVDCCHGLRSGFASLRAGRLRRFG